MFQRGFIPGPQESEEAFLRRSGTSIQAAHDWQEAHEILQRLYQVKPDWIPLHFSNRDLPFWQGAATWIGEASTVQLRERFRVNKGGLYTQKEVLAHEAVHAMRCAFEEPRFEEMLAYQTSASRLRRWFGPLFRVSWESTLLVVLLCLSLLAEAVCLFLDISPTACVLPPSAAIAYGLVRLAAAHLTFQRCKKKVGLAFTLCLTDREVACFARWPVPRIEAHLRSRGDFRGKWLLHAFCIPKEFEKLV